MSTHLFEDAFGEHRKNASAGNPGFFQEEQQHIFWNNNIFGVIIADTHGNYVDANQEACRMTGYSCDELKTMNLLQLIHPEHQSTAKSHFEQISTAGKAYGEVAYFTKSGEMRWWNVVATRLSDDYFIGFHEDITERRQSDADIRLLAQVSAASRDLVVVIGADYRYRYANDHYLNVRNLRPEDIIGHHMIDIVGEKAFEELGKPQVDAALRGEVVESLEWSDFGGNDQHYLSVHVVPYREADGAISGIVMSGREITEQWVAEEKLKENELKFRTLFENSEDAIFIMQGETFVDCNASTLKIYGCQSRDQILGKSPFAFSPPVQPNGRDSREYALEIIEKAMAGQTQNFEWVHIRLDGSPFTSEVKLNKLLLNGKTMLQAIVLDITERKHAEEALRQAQEHLAEREAQYRLIAENSKDLIYVYHLFPEPGYDYISPSCFQLTGYAPEEGYADPFAYHKFINTAAGVERFTRFLLDPEQPSTIEEEWKRKDGTLIWVEQVVSRKYDENGNLISFQSTVRDITERKKSRAVIQDIIDKNPMSIQILDLEGYTLQTNLAHTTLFGVQPPANYSMFSDNQLLTLGFGDFFEAIRRGETVFFPDTHYNISKVDPTFPDKPVWIKAVGFPLKDTRGNPEYYVLMHENITERKSAEEELHKRERRFSQLIQNSYDTIVILDADGTQRYVSPSAEKVHGYSPSELVDIPVIEIMIHPDDREKVSATFQTIIDTGSGSVEYRHRHKSGGWVYLEAYGSNQLENPDIKGVVVNVRDITERKKDELLIRENEMTFAEINECLVNLGSDYADNINTLTALCGRLLGAACALYNRLEGGMLCSLGQWSTPAGFNGIDNPDGHICYDVIRQGKHQVFLIRNLPETKYYDSDPNVRQYNLLTYAGHAVFSGEEPVGSLCVVFQHDTVLSARDSGVLSIIASALASEEQRYQSHRAIEESNRKFRELSTLMRLMTDNMPDMLWAKNLNKEFIFTNKAICRNMLGAVDTDEPLGKNDLFFAMRQRNSRPDNPEWHTFGEICQDSDSITLEELKPMQFDEFGNVMGKFLFLDVHKAPLFDDHGELIGIVGSARDITERKALEEELHHQTRLRELLMEISSGFINISLEKVDESVNEALCKMGQFVQADRSYTFDYDWEKKICRNTYEWCNEGVGKEIDNLQNLPLSIMLDTVAEHKKGKTVYIPDVNSMPTGIAKEFIQAQGVLSFIMVPMMNQNECIGFVGFDSVKGQKEYFSNDVLLLEVFAQLLANVKQRQSMVNELVAAKLLAEESEEKHRSLIEQMLEGLVVDDEDGIIRMVNPMFCKMTGYSEHELIGKSGYSLMLSPEDITRMQARDEQRRQNIPGQYELEVITKSGELRTFWCHATPIVDKNGRYLASMSTMTDITRQKQDQEHIRITKESYESILNSVSEAIYVLDENGIFIEVNRGAEIMYGYTREELIGKSPADVSAPGMNDLETVGKIMEEVAQTGLSRSFEFWGVRKNGEIFPKDVSINRGKYFGRNHIIATARDITERKKTETARRIQYTIARSIHVAKNTAELLEIIRKELGQLFDTTNFFVARYYPEKDMLKPLIFYDENDRFEEWDAATSLSGQVVKNAKTLFLRGPEVDAYSREFQLPVLGSDSACWLGVPVTINHRVSAVMVIQHYTNPGAYTEADVALLEMVAHETGIFLEKQLMIEDLIQARDRAEESDRLKSAFLANMSHEIRTPMNGILGFVDLLREPDLTGEERQKYIAIINKSGQRMLNIINDIIDISKIEAGLMEIHLSESNINEQLEYIYTFFKPETARKGLEFRLTDRLAEGQTNWKTDREKLYAVLTNLVKNAIKYTHQGRIEMGCQLKNNSLGFFVKDSGIGIPLERQQAVFERFIQADIEDRMAYQGAGLGLTISKNYVEMLGGKMWLESREGRGTTVYFTLPC